MAITLRSTKGTSLTYSEMDENFDFLDRTKHDRMDVSYEGEYTNPKITINNKGEIVAVEQQGAAAPATDITGSVFGDDSTKIVDGVENKVYAANGFFGNLTGSTTGTHSGNVIADDSTVLVEAYSGTINLNNTSITSLIDVGYASATIGHVLKWDGTRWTSQPESGAAVSASNADLLDGFDGTYYLDYTNFSNKPTLATVATSNDYTDLDNTPTLAAVATSNDYNDLDNKPSAASTPIGEGQTWQDVTASRALNTTYTNTTGRPIMISIYCAGQPNHCEWELLVDGVQLGHQGVVSVASAAMRATMSAIVPAGSTYRANNILNAGLQSWAELR